MQKLESVSTLMVAMLASFCRVYVCMHICAYVHACAHVHVYVHLHMCDIMNHMAVVTVYRWVLVTLADHWSLFG